MSFSAQGITRAEFARQQGWAKSYVTKLANEGRLVEDDKGFVQVSASLLRIRDTADPSKAGVASRHAALRAPQAPPSDSAPAFAGETAGEGGGSVYQSARAKRETFAAMKEELEYQRLAGTSCDVGLVRAAAEEAGAQLRQAHEAMIDRLVPELAATADLERIRALLVEASEAALRDVSTALARAAGMPALERAA